MSNISNILILAVQKLTEIEDKLKRESLQQGKCMKEQIYREELIFVCRISFFLHVYLEPFFSPGAG